MSSTIGLLALTLVAMNMKPRCLICMNVHKFFQGAWQPKGERSENVDSKCKWLQFFK